jgi:hypothetical protein
LSGVDGTRFETLATLELELWQLWLASATMAGMSQLWAKISLGFKQYHKGQENRAKKGPKVGLGQQRTNFFFFFEDAGNTLFEVGGEGRRWFFFFSQFT